VAEAHETEPGQDLGQLAGVVRAAGGDPPADYPAAFFSLGGEQLAWLRADQAGLDDLEGEYVMVVTKDGPGAQESPPHLAVEAVERTGVHPPDPRRSLEVRKGEELTVELPGHATAGYEWQVKDLSADSPVRLKSSDYVPGSGMDAVGRAVFVFSGVDAGEAEAHLSEGRPWEPEPVDAVRYRFRVS
jgi:predicted secreted protein